MVAVTVGLFKKARAARGMRPARLQYDINRVRKLRFEEMILLQELARQDFSFTSYLSLPCALRLIIRTFSITLLIARSKHGSELH